MAPSGRRRGGPGGNVTVWLFGCRRGHRHGRAPWPGPNRGLAGRAAGSPARSVRAEPSAGGYGSAALFLTSGRPPILGGRWRSAWPWWPGSWGNGTKAGRRGASLKGGCRVECRRGAIGHPKVLHQQVGAVRWVDLATASGRSTSRGLQVLHRARVARLPRQSDRRTAATGRRAPTRAGKRVSAATTTTVPTITAAIQEVGRLALGAPPATRAATW